MYALSKLNRQNEQTWVNLQKRLNEVQFSYEKLFPNSDVHDFIKNKAFSVGSCEGYFTSHNNCVPPGLKWITRSNVDAQSAA